MFLRRTAFAATRRIARPVTLQRPFSIGLVRRDAHGGKTDKHADTHAAEEVHIDIDTPGTLTKFEDVKTDADLLAPGAEPGEIPTDYVQSTGLERLEILGKMQGVDIFDMRPLPADRLGTLEDPIMVKSAGDEQYVGCTGCPADSHVVLWITLSRNLPTERCPECGSVYGMEYVGPPDDHSHDHHGPEPAWMLDGKHNINGEPITFADHVKPEYRYK